MNLHCALNKYSLNLNSRYDLYTNAQVIHDLISYKFLKIDDFEKKLLFFYFYLKFRTGFGSGLERIKVCRYIWEINSCIQSHESWYKLNYISLDYINVNKSDIKWLKPLLGLKMHYIETPMVSNAKLIFYYYENNIGVKVF